MTPEELQAIEERAANYRDELLDEHFGRVVADIDALVAEVKRLQTVSFRGHYERARGQNHR